MDHLRSLDVTESGPLDCLYAWVGLHGKFSYLTANMLPFPIAVGPDEEDVTVACLLFNIPGDGLLVLK